MFFCGPEKNGILLGNHVDMLANYTTNITMLSVGNFERTRYANRQQRLQI